MTNTEIAAITDVAPARDRRRRSDTIITSAEHRPVSSKSATVIKLLSRAKGASVAEMTAMTNWQPHSVRAFLSGLRKKASVLIRDQRKNGEQVYRIAETVTAA